MLNDARARNEVLSHAYTELQAEYIKLKSSPSPASNLDGQQNTHTQSHHHHLLTTPYNSLSGSSISVNLGDMFMDTAPVSVLNAENDPGSYLYSNVGSYAL